MPDPISPKRRRQILTDESGGGLRFDCRGNENTWPPEDPWVRNFIVRLVRMLKKTGGKN
jgi:hypothetical protein